MKQPISDQRGIAHFGLILVVLIVVAVAGFAGYKVISSNKDKSTSDANTAAEAIVSEAVKFDCAKLNDDDLCKFYKGSKEHKQYRMTSSASDGNTIVIETDGDNSRFAISGQVTMESVTIGKDTYTKGVNTWFKQSRPDDQNLAKDYSLDLDEPATSEDDTAVSKDKSVYKKLGKEACGNLTCFKYEVADPDAKDQKQYLWFDDKDYQLRRWRVETPESTAEFAIEYNNVTIAKPSPVRELGPNEYVMPGSDEVMTMPDLSGGSQ